MISCLKGHLCQKKHIPNKHKDANNIFFQNQRAEGKSWGFQLVTQFYRFEGMPTVQMDTQKTCITLAGVDEWTEHWPENQKVAGSFLSQVRAQAWALGQVPSWGRARGS